MDVTQIYNMALNAVSARNTVSLPSERSLEAETCTTWYESIRDQVLASARWPEATKFDYLSLLSSQDDDEWLNTEPRPGYAYMYALPSDALRPQFLTDWSKFSMATNGTQRTIMSNTESAALAYTARIENPNLWSAELRMGIVYGLAATICMPLTGKAQRTQLLINKANDLILAARESAANTDNETYESIPDWISARGYGGSAAGTRYFYPYGALISA